MPLSLTLEELYSGCTKRRKVTRNIVDAARCASLAAAAPPLLPLPPMLQVLLLMMLPPLLQVLLLLMMPPALPPSV